MRFGTFVFLFFCLLSTLAGPKAVYGEVPLPVTASKNDTDRIGSLLNQGDYLGAQKIYGQMLKDPSLTRDRVREIREKFETLNIKILFSHIETPTSFFYTVVSGDNLTKIAKRFHTTVAFIQRSNRLKSDTIYPGMKLKVVKGTFSIQVDKSDNVLALSLDGRLIKHYPVATGEDGNTPTGSFKIVNKLENPTWFRAGAVVPPESPENILGTRWLGFDYPSYGIHGTTKPETIGRQATAGCVRMFNRDVEELYTLVPVETQVTITE